MQCSAIKKSYTTSMFVKIWAKDLIRELEVVFAKSVSVKSM
jgi:hypothetical protein